MTYRFTRWLVSAVVAVAMTTAAAHAEVKELPAKQTKQSIELDYQSGKPGTPGKSPDCKADPNASSHVNCVAVLMDGPQGGTAATANATLARVPVTPVLKEDDSGGEKKVFVELTAETGSLDNIGSFPGDVQTKLRHDLYLAKVLLSKVHYTLSKEQRKKLLDENQPIEIRVKDGWKRLALLKPVRDKITIAPPEVDRHDFKVVFANLKLIHNYYPPKPEPGAPFDLGFRVFNLTTLTAANTTLDFQLNGGKRFAPVDKLELPNDYCVLGGAGRVVCSLGNVTPAMSRDMEIRGILPQGGLFWSATVYSDGEKKAMRWSGRIAAPVQPIVEKVFVLDEQTAKVRPESTDFKFPYPTGSGPTGRSRVLFILGENLLKRPTDDPKLESLSSDVSYRFLGHEDQTVYKHWYKDGWKEAAAWLKESPDKDLRKDYDGLLVWADLKGGVLPGEKALKISGEPASWGLRFGGLKAIVEFVRGSVPREQEVIDAAYTPERFRVRVKTTNALPLGSIPILVHEIGASGKLKTHHLTAQQEASGPGGSIYVTQPIRLVDKGRSYLSPPPLQQDVPINVRLSGPGPFSLRAEVDPNFINKSFTMPITPKTAALALAVSPGKHVSVRHPQPTDWLFKTAMKKAMVCHCSKKKTSGGALSQYCDPKTLANWDTMSDQTSDTVSNLVLLTFFVDKIRTTTIKIGDHAAALLSRDMFIEMLEDLKSSVAKIRSSRLALKAYRESMLPYFSDPAFPINAIKVTLPDGSTDTFGGWPLMDADSLAKQFNSTPDAMRRWRLDATSDALGKLVKVADGLIADAQKVGDCDAKGLLNLTAFGFDAVRARLKPRLMTLHEDRRSNPPRLYWVRDTEARYWLKHLVPLAEALRKQKEAAYEDDKMILQAATLATLPISMAGEGAVNLAVLALDAANLGWTAHDEIQQVLVSKAEIDFSRRASVVLGFKRNDMALKHAKSWLGALGNIAVAAVPVAMQYRTILAMKDAGLMALLRSSGETAEGMRVTLSLETRGIASLSEIERRHLALFAVRCAMKREAGEALTALERQAAAHVDELLDSATLRPGTILSGAKSGTSLVDVPSLIPRNASKIEFVVEGTERSVNATTKMFARINGPTGPPPLPPIPLANMDELGRTLYDSWYKVVKIKGLELAHQTIRFTINGEEISYPLGELLGSGSFTTVLKPASRAAASAVGEHDAVIKITFRSLSEDDNMAKIAQYGYDKLSEIKSPHFRLYKQYKNYEIPAGEGPHAFAFQRVEVAENIPQTARQQIAAQGGVMTKAQRKAYIETLRDINRQGYAWLDSKGDNFAFEEINGKTRVVIIDTGGVVRLAGPQAAERARELQLLLNGPIHHAAEFLHNNRLLFQLPKGFTNDYMRFVAIINQHPLDFADFASMGIGEVGEVGIGAGVAREFPQAAKAFEALAP